MNYTVISWCPGDKCDPCAPSPPVLVDAVLRASCAMLPPGNPAVPVGDPYIQAVGFPLYGYYWGKTFGATITVAVQDKSISVTGESAPIYGVAAPVVYCLWPDTPVQLDPLQDLTVTATAGTWTVYCIPFVVIP